MALVVDDRIKETTTTTNTGSYSLAGAVTGFQSFSDGVGTGNTTYYCCTDGTDYEIGLGTLSGTTLARTTILESSNSNSVVSWSAGSKDIFCTLPASKAVFKDASNNVTVPNALIASSVDATTGGFDNLVLNKGAGFVAPIIWEGSTQDDYETTLNVVDPTADRTISLPDASGTVALNDVATTSANGLMSSSDKSKLNNVESGATADQTDAEIKTAYENNSDTNAFTDALQTKLNGIEANATADQTAAEILTAIKTVDGAGSGLDADTLDGQEASAFLTAHPSITAASSSDNSGRTYIQDITLDSNGHVTGIGTATETVTDTTYSAATTSTDGLMSASDKTKLDGVESNATADQTGAEIKTAYEGEADTNAFTDALLTKLNGIEASADVTDSTNVQSAGALMDSEVTNLSQVKAFDSSDYATAAQGTTADNAMPTSGGTFTGDVKIEDNEKLHFGDGQDLSIHHYGDNWIVSNNGDLHIRQDATDKDVKIQADNANGYAVDYFQADGSTGEVILSHFGYPKITTKSTGVEVTGTVTDDGATHDGDVVFTGNTVNIIFDQSADALSFGDGARAYFGSGSDLTIYHEGVSSETRLWNVTGDLNLTNFANDKDIVIATDNGSGGTANYFVADGSTGEAQLFHYGSEKLATQSGGINVTGTVTDDGATHDGDVTFTGANYNVVWDKSDDALEFPDNAKAVFGTGSDYSIYCDGSSTEELVFEETGDGSGVFTFLGNLANLVGPIVRIEHDIPAGENTSIPGTYQVLTKDAGGTGFTAFSITAKLVDNTSGASTSEAQFAVKEDGNTAPQEYLKLDGDAENVQILKPLAVTGDIIFEGATADDFETTVTVTDPTADQTITLPDQTGTAMLWQNSWPDDPANGNQAIGENSLASLTTGYNNVAYGRNAGQVLTTGYRNTAIGDNAFQASTTAVECTAVGERALYATSTGIYNTAVGLYALGDNTTGSNNVAIGVATGRTATVNYGTYVGSYAGNYYWWGGSRNHQTFIGYNSGNDATSDYATAVGSQSLSDGNHYQSVAVGYDALGRYSTYYPYYNTAVGYGAGSGLYSGDYNVLVGRTTSTHFNSDSYGVAVGAGAYASNSSVAVGYNAMGSQSGTNNSYNTCIGREAGYDFDGGADHNVFAGYQAGYSGGTGDGNVGLGSKSLYSLTSGTYNSALGFNSLYRLTTGNYNCSVGNKAGYNVTTGSNNTFVGHNAGYIQDNYATTALDTGSNVTCLGYEAVPSSTSATNEITLGDNNISSLRCNVQTISSLSDERDKTAISDIPYGLDFINDMRPVQFTWNRRDGSMGAKPDIGFIAQELYETELDHSSSSRTRLVNWENPEKLEADYVRSYPILVKAVQELSAKCDALEARLAALEGA